MQDCTAPSPTARGFFALDSGCALVLRELTLRNGKASGSGSANKDGANLDASCVAFGGNSATYVRAAPLRCRRAACAVRPVGMARLAGPRAEQGADTWSGKWRP